MVRSALPSCKWYNSLSDWRELLHISILIYCVARDLSIGDTPEAGKPRAGRGSSWGGGSQPLLYQLGGLDRKWILDAQTAQKTHLKLAAKMSFRSRFSILFGFWCPANLELLGERAIAPSPLATPISSSTSHYTEFSGIAMQYATNRYSRRGNFGGSLVHSMFITYSPDGTKVCSSRSWEFEGIGSVWELKVVKLCS